jgi:hypothetical protein
MYLVAKEISTSNLFTNWKGREGKFVRTFGMNSQRNKNEWRATWDSIKKYIHTALEFPGIEYEVCKAEGCDLDHVEAETFEENVAKQRPFERTKIIDYVLNEEEESVDLIHEVNDDDFWEKLRKKEIKYVSPLIWPLANGVKVLGHGRADLPIIDTTAWKFVHHAFLKNSPAYGDDIATVKTMCDGKNCDVKLLAAKVDDQPMCGNCKYFVENNTCELVKGEIRYEDICDLHEFGETQPKDTLVNPTQEKSTVNYRYAMPASMSADTTVANQENISHLQEIPLLYKHKGQLILLSASTCVQDIIKKKKDSGIEITDQELAIAYSECGESKGNKAKSSFKTCTCKAKQSDMDESEHRDKMKANEDKVKELESKLKAQEDTKDEEKSYESKKARYAKMFANVEEAEREKMVASLRANEDDKDDLKAATEVDEDMKKSKKANTDDPEKENLKARVSALEAKEKTEMIVDLVSLKAKHNLSQKDVNEYHAALKGKTHDEILSKYEDNKFEIKNMKASIIPETSDNFVFNGNDVSGLKGKTFTEIAEVST